MSGAGLANPVAAAPITRQSPTQCCAFIPLSSCTQRRAEMPIVPNFCCVRAAYLQLQQKVYRDSPALPDRAYGPTVMVRGVPIRRPIAAVHTVALSGV